MSDPSKGAIEYLESLIGNELTSPFEVDRDEVLKWLDDFAAAATQAERQRCERIASDDACGCGTNTAFLIRDVTYKGPTYEAIYSAGYKAGCHAMMGAPTIEKWRELVKDVLPFDLDAPLDPNDD